MCPHVPWCPDQLTPGGCLPWAIEPYRTVGMANPPGDRAIPPASARVGPDGRCTIWRHILTSSLRERESLDSKADLYLNSRRVVHCTTACRYGFTAYGEMGYGGDGPGDEGISGHMRECGRNRAVGGFFGGCGIHGPSSRKSPPPCGCRSWRAIPIPQIPYSRPWRGGRTHTVNYPPIRQNGVGLGLGLAHDYGKFGDCFVTVIGG